MRQPAILALEDGTIFRGVAVGASGDASGEVVFNTAMTGYQEILTDPSYCRQIVTLTYPHIGNTGANPEDYESDRVQAAGLIIRDLPLAASNWRATESFEEFLVRENVAAIAEIDTRRLTSHLRENGAMAGCIMSGDDDITALEKARACPGLLGMDLARVVSTKEEYRWTEGVWCHSQDTPMVAPTQTFDVVAYDFGIKRNILRLLVSHGCNVTVVPANTPAERVLEMNPDGVFLSNGPGDPEPCSYAISAIRTLLDNGMPLFGICLGHQLLALACGARTEKMKFGHHGANHPVQDLRSGAVAITSQNHGFAVAEESLGDNVVATHRSLFDKTLQGVAHVSGAAFGFQGHPEASPGPHDLMPLFKQFVEMMAVHREGAARRAAKA